MTGVVPRLCPLDGNPMDEEPLDEFWVCSKCQEILAESELVAKATPETWAAYLVAGNTETNPADAPLNRLVGAG